MSAILSDTVICSTNIIPIKDKSSYYMSSDNMTNTDSLDHVLTSEEYECFKTLLMKVVKTQNINIRGNHTIKIIHRVDH